MAGADPIRRVRDGGDRVPGGRLLGEGTRRHPRVTGGDALRDLGAGRPGHRRGEDVAGPAGWRTRGSGGRRVTARRRSTWRRSRGGPSARPERSWRPPTALPDLDATKEALLGGEVSESQGQIIANAAKANPQAERDLIEKAKRANHQELRDEAQKAKAAADKDADARHRRIHSERRLSRHTDLEGAWNLHAKGTVAGRVGHLLGDRSAHRRDLPERRRGGDPGVPRRLRLRRAHRDGPPLGRSAPRPARCR